MTEQSGYGMSALVSAVKLVLDIVEKYSQLPLVLKVQCWLVVARMTQYSRYIRGPTDDKVIPLLKMSSAIVKPSGTPPIFLEKLGEPLFSTVKASKTQWTPR